MRARDARSVVELREHLGLQPLVLDREPGRRAELALERARRGAASCITTATGLPPRTIGVTARMAVGVGGSTVRPSPST